MAPNRLNQLLTEAGSAPLNDTAAQKFADYLALLLKWNAKTNLTAIRDEEGIQSRHFLESILCARSLPEGIGSLLDFGSGAGFPGLPIALLRPEITVTLAESQGKKAAFLREAVRVLGLKTTIHAGRAEELKTRFDCVTLRAVDDMPRAVAAAAALLAPGGWLAVLTTISGSAEIQAQADAAAGLTGQRNSSGGAGVFQWQPLKATPAATERGLLLGQRTY